MLNLFNPVAALLQAQREEKRCAEYAKQHGVPFETAKRPRAEHVYLQAASFTPHNPLAEIFPDVPVDGSVLSPSGALRYSRKSLPAGCGLQVGPARSLWSLPPCAFFDADVVIPVLEHRWRDGSYEPWMSLTPFELWTLRGGVRAATGQVVLGGLGMGWLLSQIVAKPRVDAVTVIESDAELIFWFGKRLCDALPKVTLVHGNFFALAPSYVPNNARFVVDVWPRYGDAKYDSRLAALRGTGAHVWAWGSAR